VIALRLKIIVLVFALLAFASASFALTPSQMATIKADILADQTLNAFPNNSDGAFAIAAIYNANASPNFWVWRTSVSQLEAVTAISVDGTTWSWTLFIGRSQAERDAWREMFADGGVVNPSLTNVRQGFADIFSGPSGTAQLTHLSAIGRRLASRIEKLLATGTGSTGSPATMGFEGPISYQDIFAARNS
jgi:hypothetical protein